MFKRLYPYLRRYRKLLIAGLILVILKNLFQSVSPQIVKMAIDSLQDIQTQGALYHLLVAPVLSATGWTEMAALIAVFLTIETAHAAFLFGMRKTMIVASRKIELDFRNDFFSHLQTLPPAFYHYRRTGDLMSRMTNDLANVREILGPGIMYTANTIVSFFYVVPLMLQMSPLLTLTAFLPMAVLSVMIYKLARIMHHRAEQVQAKLSDISSEVHENFSGIRIIQSYVLEPLQFTKFRKLNEEYFGLNMAMVRIRGLMMASVIGIIGLSVALLLLAGGWLVIQSRISLGTFTAFNFYLAMLIWPMISIGWVLNIFQRGAASLKRMEEVLSVKSDASGTTEFMTGGVIRGTIEFRNLTFTYTAGQTVLKDITLSIPAGSTLGIVGKTGSGKSTLIHLIPGLYPSPPGSLWIDNTEINRIPPGVLRAAIGMVPQDPFLFSDTIRSNILFGKPDATEIEIREAAEWSRLDRDLDQFPDGLDTVIGERGVTLSGGQKQRLAIARALIRRPAILILDDALSAVDTRTEDEILQTLRALSGTRTILIVSHRIHTVRHADTIIYLRDGAIAEQGTHDELMALNGAFARMYRHQLLEEEIEHI